MGWTLTDDLDAYSAAAEPLLRGSPVVHNVPLTVAEGLRAGEDRYDGVLLGWWTAGPVRGVVMHTLPHNLILAEVPPEAVDPLADALAGARHPVPGAAGRPETVRRFAAAWCARTGGTAVVEREERLYVLDRLVPPDPMPAGGARAADEPDRALLTRWMARFQADAGLHLSRGGTGDAGGAGHPTGGAHGTGDGTAESPADGDDAAFVTARLAYGGLTLWERDGEPVALAGVSRPGAGTVRVGPVYTPPERRRQGYGTAVTAAVSRAALDAGAGDVVLYTDLANPTSNAIYQAIGYRPVEDRLVMTFTR